MSSPTACPPYKSRTGRAATAGTLRDKGTTTTRRHAGARLSDPGHPPHSQSFPPQAKRKGARSCPPVKKDAGRRTSGGEAFAENQRCVRRRREGAGGANRRVGPPHGVLRRGGRNGGEREGKVRTGARACVVLRCERTRTVAARADSSACRSAVRAPLSAASGGGDGREGSGTSPRAMPCDRGYARATLSPA